MTTIKSGCRSGVIGAVALGALAASGASAQNNTAYVDQLSTTVGNSATLTQNGGGNQVGDSSAQRTVLQDGDNNAIIIDQGGGDIVGTGGNFLQNNQGVDQIGDNNALTVDQTGLGGSRVFEAQQLSLSGGVNGNQATVTQSGNAAVSRINQTYDGTGGDNVIVVEQNGGQFQRNTVGDSNGSSFADRGIFQDGADQEVLIVQGGGGNNDIFRVSQSGGNGNIATLEQSGGLNLIALLAQEGDINTADVSLDGSGNGRGSFSGAAAGVGIAEAEILQSGDLNEVAYDAVGDDNTFGFSQDGDSNMIDVVVTGDDNQAAVSQTSDGNVSVFTQSGDGNNIGVTQN